MFKQVVNAATIRKRKAVKQTSENVNEDTEICIMRSFMIHTQYGDPSFTTRRRRRDDIIKMKLCDKVRTRFRRYSRGQSYRLLWIR